MEQLASNITHTQLPCVIQTLQQIETRAQHKTRVDTQHQCDQRYQMMAQIATAPEMVWEQLAKHALLQACATYRQAQAQCEEMKRLMEQEVGYRRHCTFMFMSP